MSRKLVLQTSIAILGLGLLLLTAYGPALQLPFSLIDDGEHVTNSRAFVEHLKTDGLATALRTDFSIRARIYNPGYTLLTVVLYSLSGGAPYHGLKLAGLALLACFVFLMPWVALQR